MKVIRSIRYIDTLKREAVLYVGLPQDYETQKKHYPVIYFHDGHNLFYKEDSYAGEIWDVAQAMRNPNIPPAIVVSLSCAMKGNQRIEEYNVFTSRFPNHPTWYANGRGLEYLHYVFNELKPEIDKHYRTLKDAENTYMIGSSMGGVISLEAALLFPHVLKNIAGLSNAFYTSTAEIIKLIDDTNVNLNKVYLDTGDAEDGLEFAEVYLSSNNRVYHAIKTKYPELNLRYHIIRGGKHNELAWRRRLPQVLKFLLNP
jgi:predicted alpha/beta superfamily hydrolase